MFAALGHLARLARAGAVLAREGVFAGVDPGLAPLGARLPLALARLAARRDGAPGGVGRLAVAVQRLGPTYVKLGQFLATRPDVVGVAAVRALETLQDRVPPFPRAEAVALVEAALGRPLGDVFTEFGEPHAAASVAQVHRARMREGGAPVAVKVMRPGVPAAFRRDLADMRFAARLAEGVAPEARRLKLMEVVEALARSVTLEMDFRLEAAAASEFAENTARDPGFRVPAIHWDLTARDVLTVDWVEGTALTDEAALRAGGLDLPALGRTVIQSFLRHAMRDGFFHADMHQGNLFADRDGTLVAVDFGIMGRIGTKERRFLAEILYGFIRRDYRRVAEVHFQAGYVPATHRIEDFAQAIRAIGEPIHSRTADQISMARLLTLLFEITALFDMHTRIELVMLQKTMVVVEGVARRLDPRLDLWATAEPVVRGWIEANLGPLGKLQDAGAELASLARAAAALPDIVVRGERIIASLETAVEQRSFGNPGAGLEALVKAQARWFRVFVVGLLMVGVVVVVEYILQKK